MRPLLLARHHGTELESVGAIRHRGFPLAPFPLLPLAPPSCLFLAVGSWLSLLSRRGRVAATDWHAKGFPFAVESHPSSGRGRHFGLPLEPSHYFFFTRDQSRGSHVIVPRRPTPHPMSASGPPLVNVNVCLDSRRTCPAASLAEIAHPDGHPYGSPSKIGGGDFPSASQHAYLRRLDVGSVPVPRPHRRGTQ